MDEQQMHSSTQNTNNYDTQRALVLQGGGALGAYEVGAVKSLYKVLSKEDETNHRQGRPLFDIITGTSIGAMNAAILVSNVVVKKKNWEDSINELESFWTDIDRGLPANPQILNTIKQLPCYAPWQKENEKEGHIIKQLDKVGWHDKNPYAANEEAARRHYSAKFLSLVGMKEKVFSAPIIVPDYKFFDPDEKWYLFTNDGLRKTIGKYADFPIPSNDTSNKEGEQGEMPPRLLITSVDVVEGVSVIFDSFKKPDGMRKSEYGKEKRKSRE
jgi:hypothetical protein